MVEAADFSVFTVDFNPSEQSLAETLVNNSNYVGKKLTTDLRVPGRIGNPEFYDFWKYELKASDFILDTIKNGYKFPFLDLPPGGFHKNNKSMLDNSEFALAELLRLERLGCISRVEEQPFLCLPLSVVFSKKLRLVFNFIVFISVKKNPFL